MVLFLLPWKRVYIFHFPVLSLRDLIMADLNSFFEKLTQQLHSNTSVNYNDKHCDLWLGARTSNGLYGRKQVTFPDGARKIMRVSRVIFMIQHRSLVIPQFNEEGEVLEMSHLCHNTLCVNPEHLVLETKALNCDRKHCKDQGLCTGIHRPLCIL